MNARSQQKGIPKGKTSYVTWVQDENGLFRATARHISGGQTRLQIKWLRRLVRGPRRPAKIAKPGQNKQRGVVVYEI